MKKRICLMKDRNKIGHKDEYTTTYYKLLNYLSKNSLFIQILIELLVNSYLYKNLEKDKVNDIFVIISKSNQNLEKMKEKFINLIYDHSKELLMDIYFDTRNLNKYDIIIQMFCIILKLTKGLEDNIDEYKRNLLLKFLKELFLGICQEYNKKNNFPIADYIRLFSLFVEYSFLIKSPDNSRTIYTIFFMLSFPNTRLMTSKLQMFFLKGNTACIFGFEDMYPSLSSSPRMPTYEIA